MLALRKSRPEILFRRLESPAVQLGESPGTSASRNATSTPTSSVVRRRPNAMTAIPPTKT
ncbi:MAG TPA: hypothetical protein VIL58_06980 [Thermoplasmata archaeon]